MLEPNGNLSCGIGNQLFFLSPGCFDDVDFGASVDKQNSNQASCVYQVTFTHS